MSDVAWMSIAPILQALAVLVSAAALWRANGAKRTADRVEEKTDLQTITIDQQTKTIEEGAQAAKAAAKNTDGNFDKLLAQLDKQRDITIQTVREHSENLAALVTAAVQAPSKGPVAPGGRRADDQTPS